MLSRFSPSAPRLALPPRGALPPNNDVDPLKYYYAPLVGRLFRARIDLGLRLLEGLRFRRLLEVGYGSGLLLGTLVRLADTVDGVDLATNPEVVRPALARLGVTVGDLVQGDLRALPFDDGRYDAVVAFSILEHLKAPDLALALDELARVLAPGGRLLVGCPAVHRGMTLAFRAIGFRHIEDHHFSSITDVLERADHHFAVEKSASLVPGMPLAWAPYSAVLLRRR